MARVTRSKTGNLKTKQKYKGDESSPEAESSEPSEPVIKSPVKTPVIPKRRRIKPTTSFPHEKTRRILNKLKPAYNTRPKKQAVSRNDMEFVSRVNNLVTSRLLELDPTLKNQIDELEKFRIFKDMRKADMKTVMILQSDIGELKQRDLDLSCLVQQEDINSIDFDKKFRELYKLTEDSLTL